MPRDTDKYYQFVYVKNNETIKGASKPFVFEETVPQQQEGYIFILFYFYRPFKLFIYIFYNRLTQRPRQWVQQLELFLTGKQQQQRQGVHQIIEQLFREVLPYQLLTEQQQTQLQGLIEEVQRKLQGELVEELDERRREQIKYNTQLRMFERLVEQQLKKVANFEQTYQQKLNKQVNEFEQRIQNVMRLTGAGSETREQQVEKYIARFESLVRDKLRFENEQKQAVLQGLYKVITGCDAQLKELQQSEIQYILGCHQELKERFAQIQQQAQQQCYNATQVREQLRQLEVYFGEQQQFKQAQEQLEQIIAEIEWQINEIEGAFQQQQQQQTMGRQQQQQQQTQQI